MLRNYDWGAEPAQATIETALVQRNGRNAFLTWLEVGTVAHIGEDRVLARSHPKKRGRGRALSYVSITGRATNGARKLPESSREPSSEPQTCPKRQGIIAIDQAQ